MRLLLLRHAVTEHTGVRLSGWTPGAAPVRGRAGAGQGAGRAAGAGALDALYASPLEPKTSKNRMGCSSSVGTVVIRLRGRRCPGRGGCGHAGSRGRGEVDLGRGVGLVGRSVSPGRFPHPACPSHGTGRSTSPVG